MEFDIDKCIDDFKWRLKDNVAVIIEQKLKDTNVFIEQKTKETNVFLDFLELASSEFGTMDMDIRDLPNLIDWYKGMEKCFIDGVEKGYIEFCYDPSTSFDSLLLVPKDIIKLTKMVIEKEKEKVSQIEENNITNIDNKLSVADNVCPKISKNKNNSKNNGIER